MKPFIIVVGLLVAACSTGSHAHAGAHASEPRERARAQATSQSPLSAWVILSSRTIVAGSSLKGHVIVENNTGHVIHTWGCLTLFRVVLVSSRYHPEVAWPTCAQSFTIPPGRSSYPAIVTASYNECSESRSSATTVACLPGGGPPPLPPGSYRAVLFQARHLFPTPLGIAVRLTPRLQRR